MLFALYLRASIPQRFARTRFYSLTKEIPLKMKQKSEIAFSFTIEVRLKMLVCHQRFEIALHFTKEIRLKMWVGFQILGKH